MLFQKADYMSRMIQCQHKMTNNLHCQQCHNSNLAPYQNPLNPPHYVMRYFRHLQKLHRLSHRFQSASYLTIKILADLPLSDMWPAPSTLHGRMVKEEHSKRLDRQSPVAQCEYILCAVRYHTPSCSVYWYYLRPRLRPCALGSRTTYTWITAA